MIQEAYIAGQLGKALYYEDGDQFVMDMEGSSSVCLPRDLAAFEQKNIEIRDISGFKLDVEEVKQRLTAHRDQHDALSFVVNGLDATLSSKTGSLCIEEAKSLIQDATVHSFVRRRMLASPLPTEADVEEGARLAEACGASLVEKVYRDAASSREAAHAIQASWKEEAPPFFESIEEQDLGKREFIDQGVFADFVIASNLESSENFSDVVVKHGIKEGLEARVPQPVLILNSLKTSISQRLPTEREPQEEFGQTMRDMAKETAGEIDDPLLKIIIDIQNKSREYQGPPSLTGSEVRERVETQVDDIARLLLNRNEAEARRRFRHLMEFQLEYSYGRHVVKTLTSLSNSAIDAHYFELAEKWLEYARQLGTSDAVVWATKAEILKETGHLEEALGAYEETAERFPSNAVARNGRAGLLIIMKRYKEARRILSYLSEKPPASANEWIGYHILAMSYLREGETEEAIERLAYGLEKVPWKSERGYFATALGTAKMMDKQFEDASKILQTHQYTVGERQRKTNLLLLVHAQSELSRKDEARQRMMSLGEIVHPRLLDLRDALAHRYSLNGGGKSNFAEQTNEELDRQIAEKEFFFAMAA